MKFGLLPDRTQNQRAAYITSAGVWRSRRGVRLIRQRALRWLVVWIIVAGVTVEAVLRASTERMFTGGFAFGLSAMAAAAFSYHTLLRWNRVKTQFADPDDWLNGVSATLTLVGVGNLAVRWAGLPMADWPWWELQPWLFRAAALVVLAGTTMTAARLSGQVRDIRLWIVGASWLLVMAAEVSAVASPTVIPPVVRAETAWLLAMTVVTVCARRGPAEGRPLPATSQAPTWGAMVVLIASVAVVACDDSRQGVLHGLPTAYAGLAVLGVSARLLQLIKDLTQLARTRHQALTDELTGLPNRRALVAALHDAAARREGVALLVLGLDGFKGINDRYGHSVGDEYLERLSTRLRDASPPRALVTRLGGDEFAVLLTDVDTATAAGIASLLQREVTTAVPIAGRHLSVGASVGVAHREKRDPDLADILRRADVAMRLAKSAGGGCGTYDEAIDAAAQARLRLIEELRDLLAPGREVHAENQLLVHYQPQLDARTGSAVGAEALVRWQHPRHGLLGPAIFLDLAEEYGLMFDLTVHVVRQAVTEAGRWQVPGRPVRVAVNLSASCLADPALLPLLDEVLSGTALDPAQLVIEITETTLMTNPTEALRIAHAIADRGVDVSIDDYGTGYSSLAYLNDLPATELKLDRSFTQRAAVDRRTEAIVGATIDLAHRLGMRLVAEGVEDNETLGVLHGLGCDQTQGFLHSRPLPAAAFARWLAQHEPSTRQRAPMPGPGPLGSFHDGDTPHRQAVTAAAGHPARSPG